MKSLNYTARLLSDGHISLPVEVKEGIERDLRKEDAINAFGAWSERSEIEGGVEYVEEIRN